MQSTAKRRKAATLGSSLGLFTSLHMTWPMSLMDGRGDLWVWDTSNIDLIFIPFQIYFCCDASLSDWILCWSHTGAGAFWDLGLWSKQCQMSSLVSSSTLLLCHHFFKRHHSAFSSCLSELVLGSVSRNTVHRAVFFQIHSQRSRQCIGYCDLCRPCHSISSLFPVDTKKYFPTDCSTVRLILTVLKSILPW